MKVHGKSKYTEVAYKSAVDCHVNTNQSTNNQDNQVTAMKEKKTQQNTTSLSPFPTSDHSCIQLI